jgi:hypothetical protein
MKTCLLSVVSVATMLVAMGVGSAAAQDHARVKNPAVPGEQAPPATPGQNNFGGTIGARGAGAQRRATPAPRPEVRVSTVAMSPWSLACSVRKANAASRTR